MFFAEAPVSEPAAPSPCRGAAPPPRVICHSVIACVALDFRLHPERLIAPTRGSPCDAFARQVAMYLAHVTFGLGFDAIGSAFGRDRTTVSHACAVVEDRRDDHWLDYRLMVLEQVCRGALQAVVEGSR